MSIRHGTRGAYAHHRCKCQKCLAAHAQYNREYKQGLRRYTPATPAADHINALLADGWTLAGLARHTGYHVQTLRNIAHGKTRRTHHSTIEDILSVPVKEVAA